MAGNILDKLKRGENIYGTCIVSTSPIWSKSLNNSGLDFVFLDTEHIPMDRTELTVLCQVYTAMGISPIVRIPSPDPYTACMVKDAGAVGVIAPYVENAEQIRQLVGATKFRPLKGERLQRILNNEEVLEPQLKTYLEKYNEGSLTIVNIESLAAVNNLNVLLNIDGLDAIIIGPHDLSINLGIPEQYEHPEFEKVVKKIIQKSRSKEIAAGIHFPDNPDRQIKWMKEGVNIIMHSSDMLLFHQKLKEDINKIKKATGDEIITSEDADLAI
jgi:2-keto-3-deoxy-L-rhamnonate aldolase RhmA